MNSPSGKSAFTGMTLINSIQEFTTYIMKTIVIGGATGAVGRGLVRYYATEGHRVIAILRDEVKRAELETYLSGLKPGMENITLVFNAYQDEAEISQLQKQLSALGTIDLAIASLGGWYHGPRLYELPLSEWEMVVTNSLSSHFRFAKAVLTVLEKQRSGAYALINGGASEYAVPHSGIVSMMAAAQKMMAQVLHQEAQNYGVHVFAVAAFTVVQTDRTADMDELWLTPADIGEFAMNVLADKSPKSGQYWHKLQIPNDLLV